MKKIFVQILILSTIFTFGQEITTIKVAVPNKTDEVFITGNQISLGNQQSNKIKTNRISDYKEKLYQHFNFYQPRQELKIKSISLKIKNF